MRTRLPLLPIALFVTSGSLAANLQDGPGPWYVGFSAGVNSVDSSEGFDFDEGFAAGGLIGYRLGHGGDSRFTLGLEAEYYYAENDTNDFPIAFGLSSDELQTSIVFGNLIADWYWTDTTSVYFGGGIGYAENVEIFTAQESGTAWQGKAGLRVHLGGGFSWNIGYRYLQTEDVAGAGDFQNHQHVGEMGVIWQL